MEVQIHADSKRSRNRGGGGNGGVGGQRNHSNKTQRMKARAPTTPLAQRQSTAVAEIVRILCRHIDDGRHHTSAIDVADISRTVSQRHQLSSIPRAVDVLQAVPQTHREALRPYLVKHPVRTASGVAVVAVMSKPHRCPHIAMTGNICVYCPGGPDSDFEYSTQSYTGYEPTSMRAIRARYDPYVQARRRVEQLYDIGHSVDKIEFIVMGGTFMSLPNDYRDYFIRNLHDALSGHTSASVEEAVRYSEHSKRRCIGITIETRPDYCLRPHISQMLLYGCTRLEIGVQSVYEDVARDTNRGHTVRAVCESFQLGKDSGFKVIAHMMPDLPNVDYDRDLYQFREFFESPQFRTDGLKIYPTLVIRGTGLYELWKTGRYRNHAPERLVELLAQVLALVPPWTRVYRIQRDIPMPLVTSGVEHGNIRELVMDRMADLGLQCRDVRTREIGIKQVSSAVDADDQQVNATVTRARDVELVRRDYMANGGWETFLAYEDPVQDTLIALLRLRQCSDDTFRRELTTDTMSSTSPSTSIRSSIVRELHVYGTAVPVHTRDVTKFQHKGFGTLLMEAAERIARVEHGSDKLAVISGVGTRNYYRKLGYTLDGVYMCKMLVRSPSSLSLSLRRPHRSRDEYHDDSVSDTSDSEFDSDDMYDDSDYDSD